MYPKYEQNTLTDVLRVRFNVSVWVYIFGVPFFQKEGLKRNEEEKKKNLTKTLRQSSLKRQKYRVNEKQ